jgi:hypothetical protein
LDTEYLLISVVESFTFSDDEFMLGY